MHVSTELLQRYLAGEADLTEMDIVSAHLDGCEACSTRLADLAADDAALMGALRLDEADMAWAASLDLTQPVLQEINPLRSAARPALYLMLFLLPTAWLMHQSITIIERLTRSEGTVDSALNFAQTVIPGLWQLLRYLMSGGLLASLWPLLALGAVAWFWRTKTARGASQPHTESF